MVHGAYQFGPGSRVLKDIDHLGMDIVFVVVVKDAGAIFIGVVYGVGSDWFTPIDDNLDIAILGDGVVGEFSVGVLDDSELLLEVARAQPFMEDGFEAGDQAVVGAGRDLLIEQGFGKLGDDVGFPGATAAVNAGIAFFEWFEVLCVGQFFSFVALDALCGPRVIIRTFELFIGDCKVVWGS
jgi:hypothetical protein